jgi:asparagine synthetase B (glutamine-hydrolysing)
MSMAAVVEVRVPFLDSDVVNLAARVPVTYKQRSAVGKWVLEKAMEPYLPHDVIYRPKSSFGAPLRRLSGLFRLFGHLVCWVWMVCGTCETDGTRASR